MSGLGARFEPRSAITRFCWSSVSERGVTPLRSAARLIIGKVETSIFKPGSLVELYGSVIITFVRQSRNRRLYRRDWLLWTSLIANTRYGILQWCSQGVWTPLCDPLLLGSRRNLLEHTAGYANVMLKCKLFVSVQINCPFLLWAPEHDSIVGEGDITHMDQWIIRSCIRITYNGCWGMEDQLVKLALSPNTFIWWMVVYSASETVSRTLGSQTRLLCSRLPTLDTTASIPKNLK